MGTKIFSQNFLQKLVVGFTIFFYIIIRVHSAFSLVASCVLLKNTRTDDVN